MNRTGQTENAGYFGVAALRAIVLVAVSGLSMVEGPTVEGSDVE